MKIVLIQNVDKVGRIGDTKDVAEGYARNFLVRRSLAVFPDDPRAKQVIAKRETAEPKPKIEKLPKVSKRDKRLERQNKEKEEFNKLRNL